MTRGKNNHALELVLVIVTSVSIGFCLARMAMPIRSGILPRAGLDAVVKAHHYVAYEEIYYDGSLWRTSIGTADGEKSEHYDNGEVDAVLKLK